MLGRKPRKGTGSPPNTGKGRFGGKASKGLENELKVAAIEDDLDTVENSLFTDIGTAKTRFSEAEAGFLQLDDPKDDSLQQRIEAMRSLVTIVDALGKIEKADEIHDPVSHLDSLEIPTTGIDDATRKKINDEIVRVRRSLTKEPISLFKDDLSKAGAPGAAEVPKDDSSEAGAPAPAQVGSSGVGTGTSDEVKSSVETKLGNWSVSLQRTNDTKVLTLLRKEMDSFDTSPLDATQQTLLSEMISIVDEKLRENERAETVANFTSRLKTLSTQIATEISDVVSSGLEELGNERLQLLTADSTLPLDTKEITEKIEASQNILEHFTRLTELKDDSLNNVKNESDLDDIEKQMAWTEDSVPQSLQGQMNALSHLIASKRKMLDIRSRLKSTEPIVDLVVQIKMDLEKVTEEDQKQLEALITDTHDKVKKRISDEIKALVPEEDTFTTKFEDVKAKVQKLGTVTDDVSELQSGLESKKARREAHETDTSITTLVGEIKSLVREMEPYLKQEYSDFVKRTDLDTISDGHKDDLIGKRETLDRLVNISGKDATPEVLSIRKRTDEILASYLSRFSNLDETRKLVKETMREHATQLKKRLGAEIEKAKTDLFKEEERTEFLRSLWATKNEVTHLQANLQKDTRDKEILIAAQKKQIDDLSRENELHEKKNEVLTQTLTALKGETADRLIRLSEHDGTLKAASYVRDMIGKEPYVVPMPVETVDAAVGDDGEKPRMQDAGTTTTATDERIQRTVRSLRLLKENNTSPVYFMDQKLDINDPMITEFLKIHQHVE